MLLSLSDSLLRCGKEPTFDLIVHSDWEKKKQVAERNPLLGGSLARQPFLIKLLTFLHFSSLSYSAYDAKNIETAFKWPNIVEGFIFKPLSFSNFKSNCFQKCTYQLKS